MNDTINAGVGFLFKKVSMTQDVSGGTSASFGAPGTADIKLILLLQKHPNNVILGIYISFTHTSTISSLLEAGYPGATYVGVKVDGSNFRRFSYIETVFSAGSHYKNTSNTFGTQTCGVGTYSRSVSGTFGHYLYRLKFKQEALIIISLVQ
jgi:hypothetical protein